MSVAKMHTMTGPGCRRCGNHAMTCMACGGWHRMPSDLPRGSADHHQPNYQHKILHGSCPDAHAVDDSYPMSSLSHINLQGALTLTKSFGHSSCPTCCLTRLHSRVKMQSCEHSARQKHRACKAQEYLAFWLAWLHLRHGCCAARAAAAAAALL